MKLPSRKYRVRIELHSPRDVRWVYEEWKHPLGWKKMSVNHQRRFATTRSCWEITIIIDREFGVEERVVDLSTPTFYTEASDVAKQLIDQEFSGDTAIYYASVTLTAI